MPTKFFMFFMCLSGFSGFSAAFSAVAEETAETAAPFIWWSAAPAKRLPDGRVGQILTLETSPPLKLERPEAFYRVTPLPRFNQPGPAETASWHKGEWAAAYPWSLRVEAGRYASLDVFARAALEGRPLYAQTRILLFGEAGKAADEPSAASPAPAGWPEFKVSSNGEFYWPQTGHEFQVAPAGAEYPAPAALKVVNGRGEILARLAPSAGLFKYTPPRDPELDRAGYAASKPLVFLAESPADGPATFALLIRRSRTAGLNPLAGRSILIAAFLLTALATVLARRKAAPCP